MIKDLDARARLPLSCALWIYSDGRLEGPGGDYVYFQYGDDRNQVEKELEDVQAAFGFDDNEAAAWLWYMMDYHTVAQNDDAELYMDSMDADPWDLMDTH